MSNSLAIAAVTTTLQSILHDGLTSTNGLNDTTVTILPLDKARGTNKANQVNLFLYLLTRNAAWTNSDMPRQVKPGESAISPLALNLFFLVTAFGQQDDTAKPFGHELLGTAMRILHDHPVLSSTDIRNATNAALPGNDLDQQLDRVRISFLSLSIDELSKLWTGFGMQYRLSAAYEVGVTLIESTRPTKAAVPVLTRGPNDKGPTSQADTTPPLPTLSSIDPPNGERSARLDELLTIAGVHLDGTNVGVRFDHKAWAAPVEVAPEAGATATSLTVKIPNEPDVWPAGFYTVDVLVQRAGENFRRVTNQLAFALAPSFKIVPLSAAAGAVTYTATVAPKVLPAQRAALMIGDREFVANAHAAKTDTLAFAAKGLTAGKYWVRLRVDGVDSRLVDRSQTPPVYDVTQQVTVTP